MFEKEGDDYKLKDEIKEQITIELYEQLNEIQEQNEDEIDEKDNLNGELCFKINEKTYYEKIRELICSDSKIFFKYDVSKIKYL
jgi:hypothetical protein